MLYVGWSEDIHTFKLESFVMGDPSWYGANEDADTIYYESRK